MLEPGRTRSVPGLRSPERQLAAPAWPGWQAGRDLVRLCDQGTRLCDQGTRLCHQGTRLCHQGTCDACCNVAIAITTAPAQDVSRMFTTPSINGLRRHLELKAVLAAIFNEGAKVVDELCGGVVPHMCRVGERLVVDCP